MNRIGAGVTLSAGPPRPYGRNHVDTNDYTDADFLGGTHDGGVFRTVDSTTTGAPTVNLDGAVSIVTGATGGIGSATALALAEQARSDCHHRARADRLAELNEAIVHRGGQATTSTATSHRRRRPRPSSTRRSSFILDTPATPGPQRADVELVNRIDHCLLGI